MKRIWAWGIAGALSLGHLGCGGRGPSGEEPRSDAGPGGAAGAASGDAGGEAGRDPSAAGAGGAGGDPRSAQLPGGVGFGAGSVSAASEHYGLTTATSPRSGTAMSSPRFRLYGSVVSPRHLFPPTIGESGPNGAQTGCVQRDRRR